jgi:hypothetical protein
MLKMAGILWICIHVIVERSELLMGLFITMCCLLSCLQVQCTGSAPTMSVDKCDGVQAYIPAALSADPNFQVRPCCWQHPLRPSACPSFVTL